MTTYRKKLIEVALPLEAINKAAAREKSIRHGHPSTLHLWWARRPLAACRAVLFASLVDDPDSDPAYRRADGTVDEDAAGIKRAELFNLIEELVQWENSNNPSVINRARAEIARCVGSRKVETGELKQWQVVYDQAAPTRPTAGRPANVKGKTAAWDICTMTAAPEAINAFLAEHAPPALDPFCGGGSIPLEAQRLGLRAYASDLNPVAVLITKALIEIPPKFAGMPPVNPDWRRKSTEEKAARVWHGAEGLAEDVRYYGRWIRDEAQRRIGHLYPKVTVTEEMARDRSDLQPYTGEELTVIGYLWARTVESPNPIYQGVHVPLISTLLINKKGKTPVWLQLHVDRARATCRLDVAVSEIPDAMRPGILTGTKAGRGKFRCLLSGDPIAPKYLKDQGRARKFGRRLLAVVANGRGRVYLPASATTLPDTPPSDFLDDLPCPEISGYFNPPIYGYTSVGSMFDPRQKLSLETFADLVQDARRLCLSHSNDEYARAVALYLALGVGRLANRLSSFCIWDTGRENVAQTFSEQGVPMSWDYVETNPLSGSTGSWQKSLEYIPACIERVQTGFGSVSQRDAAADDPSPERYVISTDPPYYSSIAYADFADFFYGVFRRCLTPSFDPALKTMATPKTDEAVAAWHRFSGDRAAAARHFTAKLEAAMRACRRRAAPEFPVTIYYAFKQQDVGKSEDAYITAWESILQVIIAGGLQIVSTWPMRTEQTGGRKADKNSLASSIVVTCRPALSQGQVTTRRALIAELRPALTDAVRHLQRAALAPIDLAQSAIGPGMAVFTRYSKVMETDGSAMTVRTALGLINQALDEVLAEQEGEFDADTRWALAWFEQFGMDEGPFGVAETLSKAKNTAVNGLVEAGVVKARAGKVRLLRREELPADWDPATDKRLTMWEITQYLIRELDREGESGAAALLRKLGGAAEVARDLAYRLYTICERKKWADEALAYNGLVIAWPELTKLAMSAPPSSAQADLF